MMWILGCALSLLCLIPLSVSAGAKVLSWIEVSDPTFGGSIYFLTCKEDAWSGIDSDGAASPLNDPVIPNRFTLDIERRTLQFRNGKDGKLIKVKIKASRLEANYAKSLEASHEKDKLHVNIEFGPGTPFSAVFAYNSSGQFGGTILFGKCVPDRD